MELNGLSISFRVCLLKAICAPKRLIFTNQVKIERQMPRNPTAWQNHSDCVRSQVCRNDWCLQTNWQRQRQNLRRRQVDNIFQIAYVRSHLCTSRRLLFTFGPLSVLLTSMMNLSCIWCRLCLVHHILTRYFEKCAILFRKRAHLPEKSNSDIKMHVFLDIWYTYIADVVGTLSFWALRMRNITSCWPYLNWWWPIGQLTPLTPNIILLPIVPWRFRRKNLRGNRTVAQVT